MKIDETLHLTEGRRLEFKKTLPSKADLAKTIVAFANDAGGELFIGVRDTPRTIMGLPEDRLVALEEQISNIIFTRCYPTIIPDISFITYEDKHIIKISVFRGSTPPYYLKKSGKNNGTFIRVGSTNRKADHTIIEELERKKRNVSFDAEPVFDKPLKDLNLAGFMSVFFDKTGESISESTLKKLELIKLHHAIEYPTNALVLFSDDDLRNRYFHFAKVECARFKGVSSDEFIDQKSITTNITIQAEEANNMDSRQSDARNKITSPVFKKLGVIDQWGNGLKLIADELKNYPNIIFRWKEVGLSFQVQFIKSEYQAELKTRQELGQELGQERNEKTMFTLILENLALQPASRSEIVVAFGMKTASGYLNRTLKRLQELELVGYKIPDKPNHPHQKFSITNKGKTFLSMVND